MLTLANIQIGSMQMLVGLPVVSGLLLGHANNIIKFLGQPKCMATTALESASLGASHAYLSHRLHAPVA